MGATAKESDLRFTTYVDNAVAWLDRLRADARFSRRIVIGHSEGSLIGIMAAQRSPVSHVVSVAGAGRPIGEVLDEQLSRGLPPALLTDARRILVELKAGRTVDSVPPPLRRGPPVRTETALFRTPTWVYSREWLVEEGILVQAPSLAGDDVFRLCDIMCGRIEMEMEAPAKGVRPSLTRWMSATTSRSAGSG